MPNYPVIVGVGQLTNHLKSLDEAITWMKRAPLDGGAEIEIRQVFDADDFGEVLTPELRQQEQRLRAQAGKK